MNPAFRFWPQQDGLRSILGELERPILEAVWVRGEASVADVAVVLDQYAYTTLKTVMERLEKKGLLKRVKHERAYVYRAALSRDALEGQASRRVIEGLFLAFGFNALLQFADVIREDPSKLAQLWILLEEEPPTRSQP